MIQTVLKYQRGRLQDDATVLTVEWRTERQQRLALGSSGAPVDTPG
ncbi:hypothetical protein [Nonomuraea rubra]